jgi:hypothetical protein
MIHGRAGVLGRGCTAEYLTQRRPIYFIGSTKRSTVRRTVALRAARSAVPGSNLGACYRARLGYRLESGHD